MTKITIYVPNNIPSFGESFTIQKDIAKYIREKFTIAFGGCTQIKGLGCYKNKLNKFVKEKVLIITIYNWDDATYSSLLNEIYERIFKELKQECIMVEINGEPSLIYP